MCDIATKPITFHITHFEDPHFAWYTHDDHCFHQLLHVEKVLTKGVGSLCTNLLSCFSVVSVDLLL